MWVEESIPALHRSACFFLVTAPESPVRHAVPQNRTGVFCACCCDAHHADVGGAHRMSKYALTFGTEACPAQL